MSRTDHARPPRKPRKLPPFPASVPRDRILHAVDKREPELRSCVRRAGVLWMPRAGVVRVTIDIDAAKYQELHGDQ